MVPEEVRRGQRVDVRHVVEHDHAAAGRRDLVAVDPVRLGGREEGGPDDPTTNPTAQPRGSGLRRTRRTATREGYRRLGGSPAMYVVLVPVKPPAVGKSRLAGLSGRPYDASWRPRSRSTRWRPAGPRLWWARSSAITDDAGFAARAGRDRVRVDPRRHQRRPQRHAPAGCCGGAAALAGTACRSRCSATCPRCVPADLDAALREPATRRGGLRRGRRRVGHDALHRARTTASAPLRPRFGRRISTVGRSSPRVLPRAAPDVDDLVDLGRA